MKTLQREWKHFLTLKWWQKLGTFSIIIAFSGLFIGAFGVFLGISEAYQKVSFLAFLGGFAAVFLILLIFVPFSTKKPFIPDNIEDPKRRREQFEWDIGMYGLYILFFGGIVWIIHSSLIGGVPSDWILFYFICWVGSALIMWSPPVRKWINNYYERNTKE